MRAPYNHLNCHADSLASARFTWNIECLHLVFHPAHRYSAIRIRPDVANTATSRETRKEIVSWPRKAPHYRLHFHRIHRSLNWIKSVNLECYPSNSSLSDRSINLQNTYSVASTRLESLVTWQENHISRLASLQSNSACTSYDSGQYLRESHAYVSGRHRSNLRCLTR